jgi:hypothetical protein
LYTKTEFSRNNRGQIGSTGQRKAHLERFPQISLGSTFRLKHPATQNIELRVIERLVEYPRDPGKNDTAVDRMCGSIREFGFKVPVLARSETLRAYRADCRLGSYLARAF